MTFWLLYLAIDGQFSHEPYAFHFAFKETCDIVGKEFVQNYGFEAYRCVKEVRDEQLRRY